MVFPSTVILSSSLTATPAQTAIFSELNNKFSANNPDLFIIDVNSGWGIDIVRKIQNFLSKKPLNYQNKIVLIQQAHQLGTEAQNALLKILEDPGVNNYIILTTPNSNLLLPTILSRCHIIKQIDSSSVSAVPNTPISPPNTLDLKTFLLESEKIVSQFPKDKIAVTGYVDQQLDHYRQQLVIQPTPDITAILHKLIKVRQMITANVDPLSAFDYFFLS
jgi:hypothetical protein